jgi:hypothetical protein
LTCVLVPRIHRPLLRAGQREQEKTHPCNQVAMAHEEKRGRTKREAG